MSRGIAALPRRAGLRCALAAALLLAAGAAAAQSVALAGRMGERALLVIDGTPQTVGIGQTAGGVRLLRWVDDSAEFDVKGKRVLLRVGATPMQVGSARMQSGSRELVLTAGPGGHFTTLGSINGRPVGFMVDTGATLVAIGRNDAERLGIDLSNARQGVTQTANGQVVVQAVVLNSVRIGDIELANVGAVVMPMAMPVVLLGNSFLSRVQMRRDNDVMRLEMR